MERSTEILGGTKIDQAQIVVVTFRDPTTTYPVKLHKWGLGKVVYADFTTISWR